MLQSKLLSGGVVKKTSKKKKLRPLGKITEELEPLWFEMLLDHKLQRHEVIGLFLHWAQAHVLQSEEPYIDGTKPVFYYGHKDGLK